MKEKEKRPNKHLRRERELKGWSQRKLAELLDTTEQVVTRWESGQHRPNRHFQTQLCQLFGKSAEELGFMDELQTMQEDAVAFAPPSIATSDGSGRFLFDPTQSSPSEDQPVGEWFISGASFLAPLLDLGLSLDALLETARIVLPVVKAIQMITRRQLLQTSATTLMGSIPHFHSKHVTEEERRLLCQILDKSIDASWRLFSSSGNLQVLVIAQTQLFLLQQCHSLLPSRDRSRFYAGVYNLIGKALSMQGRHHEGFCMHVSAHIAALEAGHPLEVTRSLLSQADCSQSLGRYHEAIETIEEALRVVEILENEEYVRTKAHLLACWADSAMMIGENTTAQHKLDASSDLLDQIRPNEQFDLASWYQFSGKYAFINKDYQKAIQEYEKAIATLSPHDILRQVLTLVPLLSAYTCIQDRDRSMAIIEKASLAVQALNAPLINTLFKESVQGVDVTFGNNQQVRELVAHTLKHIP